jgi:hypothetical protein
MWAWNPKPEIAATLPWVLGPNWKAKMPITMKTSLPFLTTMLAVVTLSLLAGCNTFKSRARQMSGVYDQLPASEQQRLERGSINVGDTPEMVYIALGNPDERRDVVTADGSQNLWIYKTYWQQYEGTAWLGYRRIIVPNRSGRGYTIFHEPVTQDVYRTHADETIRVTFANGVVSRVDQQRR